MGTVDNQAVLLIDSVTVRVQEYSTVSTIYCNLSAFYGLSWHSWKLSEFLAYETLFDALVVTNHHL